MKIFSSGSSSQLTGYVASPPVFVLLQNVTTPLCPISQEQAIKDFEQFKVMLHNKPGNALQSIKVPIGAFPEWRRELPLQHKKNMQGYLQDLYEELLGNLAFKQYVFDDKIPTDQNIRWLLLEMIFTRQTAWYKAYAEETMSWQTYASLTEMTEQLVRGSVKSIKKNIQQHLSIRKNIVSHREKKLEQRIAIWSQLPEPTKTAVIKFVPEILDAMWKEEPDVKKLLFPRSKMNKQLVIAVSEEPTRTGHFVEYHQEKDLMVIGMLPLLSAESAQAKVVNNLFKTLLRQGLYMRWAALSGTTLKDEAFKEVTEITKKRLAHPADVDFRELTEGDLNFPTWWMERTDRRIENTGTQYLDLGVEEESTHYRFVITGSSYLGTSGKYFDVGVAIPKTVQSMRLFEASEHQIRLGRGNLGSIYGRIFQASLLDWYENCRNIPNFLDANTYMLAGLGEKKFKKLAPELYKIYKRKLDEIYDAALNLDLLVDNEIEDEEEALPWLQNLYVSIKGFFSTLVEPTKAEIFQSNQAHTRKLNQ